VRSRTTGTGGYVIADAVRWAPANALPEVQVVATQGTASEPSSWPPGQTVGIITFVRPAESTNSDMTIAYTLSGTASNGVDFAELSPVRMAPGVATAQLTIEPLADSIPEGDELVLLTIQPGDDYTTGALSSATVRIRDEPFDGWRFRHFAAEELTDPAISGPATDADGDGATNLEEFQSGTDPRDPQSVFRMRIARHLEVTEISFSAGPDRGYLLQHRENLDHGSWLELTNFPPLSGLGTLSYTDAIPDIRTNRFYRAIVP
jgi:hypothetical protein